MNIPTMSSDFTMPHLENATGDNPDAGRMRAACIQAQANRSRAAELLQNNKMVGRNREILVSDVPFELSGRADGASSSSDSVAETKSAKADGGKKATQDSGAERQAQNGKSPDRKGGPADKEKPRFLRRVALSPPPAGYSGWEKVPFVSMIIRRKPARTKCGFSNVA